MTHSLFKLLRRLDAANYHYFISRHRPETVLVTVIFIGERVEVDVFEDGHMEVSRFPGSEKILGGEDLIFDLIKENEAKDA
jgi:hypothetical protein